jgi:hypothetical protein
VAFFDFCDVFEAILDASRSTPFLDDFVTFQARIVRA